MLYFNVGILVNEIKKNTVKLKKKQQSCFQMILKNIVCINHKLLKKFIRKQVYKNEKKL